MTYLKGVDLSHWQGTTPSLAGLSFVFARATFGVIKDDKYDLHRANALAHGCAFGAYHFGDPMQSIANQVAAHLAATPGESCSVLDIEANNMTIAQGRNFIALLKAAGRTVGLYMSASGFRWALGQDFDWIASWTPNPPAGDWEFWQYRGSPLDLDYFNGTQDQLIALLEGGAPTVNSYPVPRVPSDGLVGNGKVIYPSDALNSTDPGRKIISPARRMPYLGKPTPNTAIVEYVDDTGSHTGRAYFMHLADLTDIKAIPTVVAADDGYTKATQDAAVAAQLSADQAAINAAKTDAARSAAEAAAAPAKERERIATAEHDRIKAI